MTHNRLNRTRIGHGHRLPIPLLCLASLAFAAPGFAQVGTLAIGDWGLSGQTLTVPVVLEGDVGGGISALDFRIAYDPDVFEPTGIRAGAAALNANKLINANVITPGEYIVLLFGMNRTTLTGGVVAIVDFEVLGPPQSGTTRISIENTTLSAADAVDVPSRGSGRSVPFQGALPRQARPAQAPTPDDETTESDEQDSAAATNTPDPGSEGEDPDARKDNAAETPPLRYGGAITPQPHLSDDEASESPASPLTRPERTAAKEASDDRAKELLDRMRRADALRAQLPAIGLGGDEETVDAEPVTIIAAALQPEASVSTTPAPEAVAQVRRPTRRRLEAGSVSTTQAPELTAEPIESGALPTGSTGKSQGSRTTVIVAGLAVALFAAIFAIRKTLPR